jgi:hypothetical protein
MAISSKEGDAHETRWWAINRRLDTLGYWAGWQYDFMTAEHKYAIGLKGETRPMGIYEDEDTARAMVKMLLSNAKDGG